MQPNKRITELNVNFLTTVCFSCQSDSQEGFGENFEIIENAKMTEAFPVCLDSSCAPVGS